MAFRSRAGPRGRGGPPPASTPRCPRPSCAPVGGHAYETSSEHLADADLDSPAAILRLAIETQTSDRRELPADVAAHDPDGRRPAHTGSGGVSQRRQMEFTAA